MKKHEYVSPEMEIIEIGVQSHLMAISGGNVDGNVDDNIGKTAPED